MNKELRDIEIERMRQFDALSKLPPIEFALKGRTGRTYYAYRKPSRWQRFTKWLRSILSPK